MGSGEVIGESRINRVFPQSSLEPLRRCAPFRGETSDRYPVTGNHDRLTVLNRVEEASEVPRGLGSRHCDHDYILSDLFRIYV